VPTIQAHPGIMVGTAREGRAFAHPTNCDLFNTTGKSSVLKNRNTNRFVKPLLQKYSAFQKW
jgi:hypothetical protein